MKWVVSCAGTFVKVEEEPTTLRPPSACHTAKRPRSAKRGAKRQRPLHLSVSVARGGACVRKFTCVPLSPRTQRSYMRSPRPGDSEDDLPSTPRCPGTVC